MSELSEESKLQTLIAIYDMDREEERVQWNRMHGLFTTFMLLFLGATNVFMQMAELTFVTWSVFSSSVLVATILYCYLHNGLAVRVVDAATIKEGREILIKTLLNGTDVGDYQDNFVDGNNSVQELKNRMNSPAYPFVAFHDIIRLKLAFQEDSKKYVVATTGIVAVLLTLGYFIANRYF